MGNLKVIKKSHGSEPIKLGYFLWVRLDQAE